MSTRTCPRDLADRQWRLVRDLIPVYPGGGPRKTSPWVVLDAIFDVLRTGCQWRFLPKDFPPKSTAWRYFNEWRRNGTPEAVHDRLREKARKPEGRQRTPSAGSIDSQSVPATGGGEERGDDANKKANGRRRHVVVDTPGPLLAAVVTAAGADDGAAATKPLGQVTAGAFPRLRRAWADQKYHNHGLIARVATGARYEVEVARRPEGAKGFVVLPRGWVVERTSARLKRCRRPTADRGESVRSSEAMIRLGMVRRMLHRLRPTDDEADFRYRKSA